MAADLEAMARHYRTQGMSEEVAAARAEERLLASPAALRALVQVHTTGWERVAARLAWSLRSGFGLALVAVGICPPVVVAAIAVTTELPRAGSDPGFQLVALIAVILTVDAIRLAGRIGRTGRAGVDGFGGPTRLLVIGLFAILVGSGWFVASAYRIASDLGMAEASLSTALASGALADFGVAATVLAAALLVGIASGFAWCGLVNWIGARVHAESAALLAR